MAAEKCTTAPEGVYVCEYDAGVRYIASAEALLVAGLVKLEWLVGLTNRTRVFLRGPDGEFEAQPEPEKPRRGSYPPEMRNAGLMTVSRRSANTIMLMKYRTSEERLRYRFNEECERQQETWAQAKAARVGTDFVARWKEGVLRHVQQIVDLIDGSLGFTGFPTIKVSDDEIAELNHHASAMKRILAASVPRIADIVKEERSNVIRMDRWAYRHMH